MSQLINFDKWQVDENHPFGSGASEKKWLINLETKQTGIFKYPKIMNTGEITGEYWAVVKNIRTEDVRISPLYDNGSSLC